MTEEETLNAAQRIKDFLADEAVQGAIARLDAKYVKDWKEATTPDARESAWAKSRVLVDLQEQFRVIVSAGEHIAGTRARLARRG